ncbi:hypothetical protein O0I10_008398 [Lichtheimia ornata]|uniref:Uncharacterized protein n=1 Tax=Lichtheimia ornata TaxID=688661 RepID=A0AAD7XWX6_9FUNG|nr:uncharacterized protein O0I10_008398 [Lichtheimia ornata]KAJ8655958.1 hypothetical protein O0I10_008398 [Lichtheimia ornata]
MLFGAIKVSPYSCQWRILLSGRRRSTFEFGWVSQKQASDLYLIVVVVKDTVSMALEISYLQVVSLSVDLQSNVFIGAMVDLILQVPVRIPLGISSIVGSYDSFATVWSALSWPYQLHLRITALAVGS